MVPVIDLTKEYGIVLEGGGARGAYQVGAWRALAEAGVKISAVAGTSVGALNGALICMGDIDKAEHLWREVSYSQVMDVDDVLMSQIFMGTADPIETMKEMMRLLKDGGADITPLRKLIEENVDEEYIRKSPVAFYLLTFSISELKELDLGIDEIPPGMLNDLLIASAYLPVFKTERLHGKVYMDGGMFNNVPLPSLVNRDYKDIIMIRIFGPGREKKVKIPEDTTVYSIEPRVHLGNILDFDHRKSVRNMKIGYYDAKRLLYGLKGMIYYIEQTQEECYYLKQLVNLKPETLHFVSEAYKLDKDPALLHRNLFEVILPVVASELKLAKNWTYDELYLTMMEATAKLFRIQKYKIYTDTELLELIRSRAGKLDTLEEIPVFVYLILDIPGEE
ncbi:patatin-like phospholipase family protein [Diplocloster agilis]|uniref:patatin-like phospholipase family protein n=1 Tax=Diplocloster agilis TaxID=2850323 RepID=UPI00082135DF|nr:patatin-like phospholipase family protein [Suonthocola fibrivorans]MCU6734259.1 patatin-like phospholipase family protein [Suonthocola fibrivorans]SCJ31662.1 Patatin-like phospholipase [uncultured Clostridium sp.]